MLAGVGLAQDDRELAVSPLPGSIVSTFYIDADIPTDASQITIAAPLRTWMLVVSLDGGTRLDWNDVRPYWTAINSALRPLEDAGT